MNRQKISNKFGASIVHFYQNALLAAKNAR
jgi:hypothetical protein